jgi:hypothetical protein
MYLFSVFNLKPTIDSWHIVQHSTTKEYQMNTTKLHTLKFPGLVMHSILIFTKNNGLRFKLVDKLCDLCLR